ncbi:arylesterase [Opitutus sp. GAS368]|uniref:arylesterase n=1 Tax=Opitutus sp. GAS368 TaxID=1882749 RepID=UPI00087DBDE1|nr:arylesterase [Opitutus sp. GAS368]SDS28372.1 acyl-CoA thioesterase-1 [Opitutus sp. GAS368]
MGLNKSEFPPKGKSQTWRAVFLALGLVAGLGAAETKTVVFFGDSLTAGLGLESPDEAFPALIQQRLKATGQSWRVVNAGLSGETTAGGLRRLDWILKQPVDIFVLELGGNDGLRGISPESSRANLQAMITRIRERQPNVKLVLAGMQMPANMGPDYTRQFAAMYPDLARENHLTLIPFLLEGIGGVASLNQADGIHPTAAGHKIVADTVWRALQPLL